MLPENQNIQKGITPEALKWLLPPNQAYNWHPLTWLSATCWIISYLTLSRPGHHSTNLAFSHSKYTAAFSCIAANDGFDKLVAGRGPFGERICRGFGSHCIRSRRVVAWVSERKDV